MPLTHAERLAYKFFAIEQTVASGHHFDATAPGDNPAFDANTQTLRHASQNAGGLFSPGAYPDSNLADARADASLLCELAGAELKLAGQTSWTLVIASGGSAPDVTWLSGTTETSVVAMGADVAKILLPGQYLKLTTSGGSPGAMTARLIFRGL